MKKITLFLLLVCSFIFVFQSKIVGQSGLNRLNASQLEVIDTLYSEILKEDRAIWIKLPENYAPGNIQKYPVVYLLDGYSLKNSLEVVYENYWGHYLPHMILVGISNQTNRTRDLTTSSIKMGNETGGAEKFTQFLEKELIPYIDQQYPTTPYRTLIGHSYGGLFTINMLINHKHLFENYIAIDPSLQWDNQKLLKEAKDQLSSETYERKSLYVSLAAEQLHMWDENISIENVMEDSSEFTLFARSIIDFSNFVTAQQESGLNFSWKVYPEDLHATVPLPTIRDGLIFLFKWYQFKSPQKYNNPETPIEELVELLKNQEKIYAEHFGYSIPPMIEEMLNGYGYMNLQMEQADKARMFFQMNIDYYPNSANAYDSMADYYESQKDYDNAIKFAMKAYEISGDEHYQKRVEQLKEKK